MRRLAMRFVLLLLPFALLAVPSGAAEPDDGEGFVVRTAYLVRPVGDARRIELQATPGGAGRLVLDANACSLNAFGDPTTCTQMAPVTLAVRLLEAKLADRTGQGRRLFLVRPESPAQRPAARLHVVIAADGEVLRLLAEEDGGVRVLPLDGVEVRPPSPAPRPPIPAPEPAPGGDASLCEDVTYRAWVEGGEIHLEARGQHPTAGWRVGFERIEGSEPPRFRLVCRAPQGMAAQVITPFRATTTIRFGTASGPVHVEDADGVHAIDVASKRPDDPGR